MAREETIDKLEEKLERMKLQSQVMAQAADIEEKKAIIRQLKKKYGRNWRQFFGGIRDNPTLRQLAGAGKKFSSVTPTKEEKYHSTAGEKEFIGRAFLGKK